MSVSSLYDRSIPFTNPFPDGVCEEFQIGISTPSESITIQIQRIDLVQDKLFVLLNTHVARDGHFAIRSAYARAPICLPKESSVIKNAYDMFFVYLPERTVPLEAVYYILYDSDEYGWSWAESKNTRLIRHVEQYKAAVSIPLIR